MTPSNPCQPLPQQHLLTPATPAIRAGVGVGGLEAPLPAAGVKSKHKAAEDHAAPMKPKTQHIWVVRWLRVDGKETRHRVYMVEFPAAKFLDLLLAAGREASLYVTDAKWVEVS